MPPEMVVFGEIWGVEEVSFISRPSLPPRAQPKLKDRVTAHFSLLEQGSSCLAVFCLKALGETGEPKSPRPQRMGRRVEGVLGLFAAGRASARD